MATPESGTATTDVQTDNTLSADHQASSVEELVVDELLVEDVSIDGMCGVY